MKEKFRNEKYEKKSNAYKFFHSILLTVINGVGIYLIMLYPSYKERPLSLHFAEVTLGTLSDIASPSFWAAVAVGISMIGVVKFGILWLKEMKT